MLYSYGNNAAGIGGQGIQYKPDHILVPYGGPNDSYCIHKDFMSIPLPISTVVVVADVVPVTNVTAYSLLATADEIGSRGSNWKAKSEVIPEGGIKKTYFLPLSNRLNSLGRLLVNPHYARGGYGYTPTTKVYEIYVY